ncbi:pyridoxal kinase PdxY [Spirochaetia bacterium]|nr:pyridoxal kinase PdxY [Spirochaetia bacterium]
MAVLSIQSHVVYGYAGNTAAVFPLQRLGREVWAINTVEFSNHTGYGAWKGKVLGAELVSELVTGLEERGALSRCEAVLSGYLGDAAAGRAIMDAVRRVRKAKPGALYCCDPVMGDVGRGFYVKPDIPDIFKHEVLALADITTPNQFELEALTGLDTGTVAGARKAMELLHQKGPGVVLVTSFQEKGKDDSRIGMLVSDKTACYRIHTPKLALRAGMAGSGDLSAAVFLSRYLETGDVKRTLELTAASVYGIMEVTFRKQVLGPGGLLELLLVQAQEELSSPTAVFTAEKL